MKNVLRNIGLITVGVVVGLGIGIMFNFNKSRWLLNGATNSQSDTTAVTIYDTVEIKSPVAKASYPVTFEVYPIAQVPVLLYLSDTVSTPYFVNNDLVIPITQRYYKDNRYEAWISGYKPSLDSMTIFQPTTTITIENTAQKVARNELYLSADIKYIAPFPAMTTGITAGFNRDRWGVSLGGGIIAVPNGVKWYALVGLKYNLLTKKW